MPEREAPKARAPTAKPHPRRSNSGKLYLENNLLRISGALFRHDAKRPPSDELEILVQGSTPEKTIVIRPDPRIGQPRPLAHKLFFALIKKHSDCGRPVTSQISFTKREIMRLVGRKSWGGKDSEELTHALHQIHHTFVSTQFKANGKWIEHSFNIFPEILIERREFASDPIEACTVTLAQPIVASLKDEHFTCLNHEFMGTLGTIGQAVYVRLFFHFANHFDGRNGESLSFQKRYDAICREWLGGLSVRRHASKIIGDQLGTHLSRLVQAGFLSSYCLAKAQASDGFVLTFKPGRAFFEDNERFYRRGGKPAAKRRKNTDIDQPLRLAYLFAERRTGRPIRSIAFVTSKDKETARQLLAELPMDEMPAFIDFALREAERTNFNVQTLGGIRQYLSSYLARREQRDLARREQRDLARRQGAAIADRERREDERRSLEARRLDEARRLFDTLPDADRAAIRAEADSRAARFSGPLRASMADRYRDRITAERYADRLLDPADR